MPVISISRLDLMKLYNGTLQKTTETYITNIKDLNFTNNQTTVNLTDDQLQFVDSKATNRSEFLTMLLISYIKKLEAKGITIKIAKYLSELYRSAITDWMLYDINPTNDYDVSVRNFVDLVNNRRQEGKKIGSKKYKGYSAGKVPRNLINLFYGDIYANRIVGHLLDNEVLHYKELVELTGCHPAQYIFSIINDVINNKYPNLILKHKDEDKRICKFSINKNIYNEVCLKDVTRKE